MGTFISPDDLSPFATIEPAKAEEMIADAEAMAVLAAPCITTDEFLTDPAKTAALKAILRGALLRWDEAGSGALSSRMEVDGPFSLQETVDTKQQRRAMFWPSEITQLRNLCSTGGSSRAFNVSTEPSSSQGYTWTGPDTWTPLYGTH